MNKTLQFERGDVIRINTRRRGGNVQDGMRPAIVVSNNMGNVYSDILTVIPLTTVMKKLDQPTHVVIKRELEGLRHDSVAMAEQITTISKNDVDYKICTVDDETMDKLNTAIRVALNV